jgi:hypothetical protein
VLAVLAEVVQVVLEDLMLKVKVQTAVLADLIH